LKTSENVHPKCTFSYFQIAPLGGGAATQTFASGGKYPRAATVRSTSIV